MARGENDHDSADKRPDRRRPNFRNVIGRLLEFRSRGASGRQFKREANASVIASVLGHIEGSEVALKRRPVTSSGGSRERTARSETCHILNSGSGQIEEGLETQAGRLGDPLHLAKESNDCLLYTSPSPRD